MDDEIRTRLRLSREQFADLCRGDAIQDNRGLGRVWKVTSDAYHQNGECLVVLRSGDLVRVERQRFADDYSLAESPELHLPAPVR